MTIKEIERRSGLPRSMIRYYESEGLLRPVRLDNGYRDYSEAELETLLKIKRLRELDLTLAEIRSVQSGELSLGDALRAALGRLGEQRGGITGAEAGCRALLEAGADWDGLLAAPEGGRRYSTLPGPGMDRPDAQAARRDMSPRPSVNTGPGPWRRFFARWLDRLLINALVCAFTVLVLRINPALDSGTGAVASWALGILLMLALEPLCLRFFGATPGKALLGIAVRYREGGRLSCGDAFERTRRVLLSGLGLNIPVIELVTLGLAYRRSLRASVQPWDGDCGRWEAVCTARSHVVSAAAVAGYIAASVLVITVSLMAGGMPPNRGTLSAGEFAENYNELADYFNMNEDELMTADGLVRDVPENVPVIGPSCAGTRPAFTFTETGGTLTRVEFTAERDPRGEGLVDSYHSYMELAAMAFIWGRPGSGALNYLNRHRLLEDISGRGFETFECEYSGVRISCEAEYTGYYDLGFGLSPREGQEQDFSLRFSLELVS